MRLALLMQPFGAYPHHQTVLLTLFSGLWNGGFRKGGEIQRSKDDQRLCLFSSCDQCQLLFHKGHQNYRAWYLFFTFLLVWNTDITFTFLWKFMSSISGSHLGQQCFFLSSIPWIISSDYPEKDRQQMLARNQDNVWANMKTKNNAQLNWCKSVPISFS